MSVLGARLAALTAVIFWGVSFVATKAALRDVTPITLIFTRFLLGTIVMFVVLNARRESAVPPRDALPMLALMGFVGIFLHQLLQVYGLNLTTAVRTGWLIGLIPIWSVVLSAVFFHERFGLRKVIGFSLGAAGAIVVVTRGDLSPRVLALPTTVGDLLILASTINWAVYSILGRKTLKRLGSTRTTTAAMFIGWAMLIPLFWRAAGWHEYRSLSMAGLAAIVFLGIGCSGLGYWFWYTALERIEPSQVAAFLYLEPVVTLLAAVTLLGEAVAASTIAGGLLVLGGVWIVQQA